MALQYLFLAFLALQGAYSDDFTASNHVAIERGLNEELAKLVEELKKAVHDAIEKIITIGEGIYEQLSDEVKEALEQGRKELEAVIAEAKQKIEEIVNAGTELGEEAVKCAQAEEGNLVELQQEFRNATQVCVSAAKEEAAPLITKALDTIKDIKERAKALVEKWDKCTNPICKVGVITQTFQEIKNIKVVVLEFVEDAKDFLQTVPAELIDCTNKVAAAHAAQVQVIIERVEDCINNIQQ